MEGSILFSFFLVTFSTAARSRTEKHWGHGVCSASWSMSEPLAFSSTALVTLAYTTPVLPAVLLFNTVETDLPVQQINVASPTISCAEEDRQHCQEAAEGLRWWLPAARAHLKGKEATVHLQERVLHTGYLLEQVEAHTYPIPRRSPQERLGFLLLLHGLILSRRPQTAEEQSEIPLLGLIQTLFSAHPLGTGTNTAHYEHRSTHPTASQQQKDIIPVYLWWAGGCVTFWSPLQPELSYSSIGWEYGMWAFQLPWTQQVPCVRSSPQMMFSHTSRHRHTCSHCVMKSTLKYWSPLMVPPQALSPTPSSSSPVFALS